MRNHIYLSSHLSQLPRRQTRQGTTAVPASLLTQLGPARTTNHRLKWGGQSLPEASSRTARAVTLTQLSLFLFRSLAGSFLPFAAARRDNMRLPRPKRKAKVHTQSFALLPLHLLTYLPRPASARRVSHESAETVFIFILFLRMASVTLDNIPCTSLLMGFRLKHQKTGLTPYLPPRDRRSTFVFLSSRGMAATAVATAPAGHTYVLLALVKPRRPFPHRRGWSAELRLLATFHTVHDGCSLQPG